MSPAAPPEMLASALVQARRIFFQVKNKFLRPKVLLICTNTARILTSLTGGSGQARGRSARMSRKLRCTGRSTLASWKLSLFSSARC